MRKAAVFLFSVLAMSYFAGCSSKDSPSDPGNAIPTDTATSTPTGTPTLSPTPTSTSTSTPTVTSTPCVNGGILGDTPSSACCYVGYVKNQTMCKPVTLAQPGVVYDIQLYVTGPCAFLQAGLYADNGSHYPGSLITVSTPISVPSTADQDFVLSLPATLLPAGTYWLAAYGNDPTAPFAYMKQSPQTGTAYFDNSGTPLPLIFQAATCCNANSILVQMGADYCY